MDYMNHGMVFFSLIPKCTCNEDLLHTDLQLSEIYAMDAMRNANRTEHIGHIGGNRNSWLDAMF